MSELRKSPPLTDTERFWLKQDANWTWWDAFYEPNLCGVDCRPWHRFVPKLPINRISPRLAKNILSSMRLLPYGTPGLLWFDTPPKASDCRFTPVGLLYSVAFRKICDKPYYEAGQALGLSWPYLAGFWRGFLCTPESTLWVRSLAAITNDVVVDIYSEWEPDPGTMASYPFWFGARDGHDLQNNSRASRN